MKPSWVSVLWLGPHTMITVKWKSWLLIVVVVAQGHCHHDAGAGRCSCGREKQLSYRHPANLTVDSKK